MRDFLNQQSIFLLGALMLCLIDSAYSNNITCPAIDSPPVSLTSPPAEYSVGMSNAGALCMLVQIKHADPSNTDEVVITNNSPGTDYILSPVARSYNKRPWETVQGPLMSEFEVLGCTQALCNIKIEEAGKYFLMSFKHTIPSFDSKLSRFFMQTTFGPTSDMIKNWPYKSNIKGMVGWVKDQINLPATKHREYLRSHTDHISRNNTISDRNIAIQHPCDENSRWKKYAFSFYDNNQAFEVVADGNKFAIIRDGAVRTVLDDFRSDDGVYSGVGSYTFCWLVEDRVGGRSDFRPASGGDCKELQGGNPLVKLTSSAINNHGQLLKIIDLPDQSKFDYVKPKQVPDTNNWLVMEMWNLKKKNGLHSSNPAQCSSFDNPYQYVVGKFPDGEMMLFNSLAFPLKNTIEEPISDGGLALVQEDGASLCSNTVKNFLNIESCSLSSGEACQSSGIPMYDWDWRPKIMNNVVICGSEGEVATDAADNTDSSRPSFSMYGHHHNLISDSINLQLQAVPYMIFLNAKDQLRQRVAFALSQLLVITPNQIDNDGRETEIYFNYYDIFVRHAFGNYRDILREVSYSPMMAEMLSFLESKSASYVLENEGRVSRPDENFAREIMQLFSIGLYQLDMDGTVQEENGEPVQTYINQDIQTFARAWTGFRRQHRRFNKDGYYWSANRMDIMAVEGTWRDPYPKLGLDKSFIGDGYPICSELPSKHFLRKGAEYRLIGSQIKPELEYEHPWLNYDNVKRFSLDSNSNLYQVLCNASQSGGTCNYQPVVKLGDNVDCFDKECDIDHWAVIEVGNGVKYEYVKQACVNYSFHNSEDLNKAVNIHRHAVCLPKTVDDVAMGACCVSDNPGSWHGQNAEYFCEFSFEKSSYASTQTRCQNEQVNNFPNPGTCDWKGMRLYSNNENQREGCFHWVPDNVKNWHWTNQGCAMTVKVDADGLVSMVHEPNFDINDELAAEGETLQSVYMPFSAYNINYFKVKWDVDGEFPSSENQCANTACTSTGNGCVCDIEVTEARVFNSKPTATQVLDRLRVGHANPASFDDGTFKLISTNNGVEIYRKNGNTKFSKHTVFGVEKHGQTKYFKNVESMVKIAGDTGAVTYKFRNPPSFLSVAKPDTRDAMQETEAVLDHYFYHPNTAPFLATRLIKRFGVSNPSPRFIKVVAEAFATGTYIKTKVTFGDGKYGNLEATIAAIVLDDESRNIALDADPSSGSLREPFLKLIAFLRAMEYDRVENLPSIMMGHLQDIIGQEIHATPSVFSFFLPDFTPPGKLADISLTAPEAQVLDSPKIIGLLNGFFSLVDIGMSNCFGGFGDRNSGWCDGYFQYSTEEMRSRGYLNYLPQSWRFGEDVVDELDVLLTGGRLNPVSKAVLVDAYDSELYANGALRALKVVQKLLVATPEFHSTNVFKSIDEPRPETPQPQPSSTPYKSIVFLNLDGGLDSYNVLIPHSNCDGGKDMFDEYSTVRGNIALDKDTLHTIDATTSNQVCNTFGLHESLPFLKTLFDDQNLSFFANTGVLQQPTTKENWWKDHRETALFSHNTQQEEINFLDIFEERAGTGVCGRMLDVLASNGFKSGSISVNGVASSLRSQSSPTLVVDPNGFQKVNPVAQLEVTTDITGKLRLMNTASSITSSFYGEIWSDSLMRALDENNLMYEEITNSNVNASFPDTDLGRQLKTVASVMKTRNTRGTDRDVYNVRIGSFDHHSQIAEPLRERLTTINDALEAFVIEMRDYQNTWDDVLVVVVSEFARTLQGNTGFGSDHAWGGNYFVASGSLDGGKILGTFPNDLKNDGPYVFDSVVVPSTSWESPWNAIAQWFGVTSSDDLNTILPNRGTFANNLWSESDLF